MLLNDLKALFGKDALMHISALLACVHQLVGYVEKNVDNESLRNVAIDAIIKLLSDEKK